MGELRRLLRSPYALIGIVLGIVLYQLEIHSDPPVSTIIFAITMFTGILSAIILILYLRTKSR